ncbi:Na-K-Cl cotransporter [Spirochaetota bacterium]
MKKSDNTDKKIKGLGTFGGVFVPNILTILGVIMYLRLGWVTGNAGLVNTLIILLIAQFITLSTAFSMSAIATSMKMKGGGAYFMVSRSFGIEAAGGIGIPLYFAQTMGIGLYIVGFAESVSTLYKGIDPMIVGLSALLFITIIAIISSKIIIRIQYIVLAVIFLSLIFLFAGNRPDISILSSSMEASYTKGYSFWSVFAVFFPAVTGILSGLSLSGDLKNPGKSIPAGTIWAIIVGAVVYFSLSVWLAAVVDKNTLVSDTGIMVSIALWSPAIYAGIWGATLTSATVNILAAPRTLQALANDGILFKFLARGRGVNNEPVIAILLTCVFTIGVIMMGDINIIAPVLTMFFLITYGTINLISFAERIIKRPGYRPTFKVHWIISLAGAIGCICVMFIINVYACIAGFACVLIIYVILKRSQMKKNWGDVRRGLWSHIIQYALEKLETLSEDPRNWRPNILVFFKDDSARNLMAHIAHSLALERGFITFVNILHYEDKSIELIKEETTGFKKFLDEEEINGFTNIILADNAIDGQLVTSQIHGIGQYKQNTIMMGWADTGKKWIFFKEKNMKDQLKTMRLYFNLNMSILLLHPNDLLGLGNKKNICIWWDPTQDNGSFMLLLAHLISTNSEWEGSKINLNSVVMEEKSDETRSLLSELVRKSRIKAEINIYSPDPNDINNLERKKDFVEKVIKTTGVSKINKSLKNIFSKKKQKSIKNEELLEELVDSENRVLPDEKGIGIEEVELKEKIENQIDIEDQDIIEKTIKNIIAFNSKNSDLVLLGFNLPDEGQEEAYIRKVDYLLKELPTTLLVNSPYDINLFG